MKSKNKRILSLCLISPLLIASTIIPVACSSNEKEKTQKSTVYEIVPTYVSQADNLLALGIVPDYYPKQLFWRGNRPYDYLNAKDEQTFSKFFYDKTFAQSMQKKLESLQSQIKLYGDSWWSFSGNGLNEGHSEEYWPRKSGSFVLYDRYLIDNSHFEPTNKKLKAEGGPITKDSQAFPVDFKMSRDLFFTLSKEDILNFENNNSKELYNELQKGLVYKDEEKGLLNPLYNFSYFAKKIKDNFLSTNSSLNFDFNNSNFAKLILDGDDKPLFFVEKDWQNPNSLNSKIYKIFEQIILTDDVKSSKLDKLNYNPLNSKTQVNNIVSSTIHHHPVFEQNLRLDGGTQAYLGTMRDSLLYLYDIALATTKFANSVEGQVAINDKNKLELMKNALNNANEIAGNLIQRIKNIRDFFKEIGVVDKRYDPQKNEFDNSQSISLGLLATSQQQGSSSALQSQSKYGFLYYDLGFKAPTPRLDTDSYEELLDKVDNDNGNSNCHSHDGQGFHCHGKSGSKEQDLKITNSIFNMDDNGWWWNLGEGSLKPSNFNRFNNQFDLIINIQYLNEQHKQSNDAKTLINSLLKEDVRSENNIHYENYELWNEGIRSPIGYNQILDSLIKVILKHTNKTSLTNEQEQLLQKSLDWGSYWKNFIK